LTPEEQEEIIGVIPLLTVKLSMLLELFFQDQLQRPFRTGYDITFIYRAWGIKVIGAEDDTMLLHHALQPESLKGLGFLGSVYTDESAWKQMRKRKSTIKRED
jgi:hypothetical protein